MTRMVTFQNVADDEEENFDVKVEWPPEQRKKICITASGHPWYPCQFGFNGDDISEDHDEKDNFSSVDDGQWDLWELWLCESFEGCPWTISN